jgi:hypothetical protein
MRLVLRFVGLLAFALAFVFVIYDGTRSIADRELRLVTLDRFWSDAHGPSLEALRALKQDWLPDAVWRYAMSPVLEQPAALVFLVLGIVLLLLGRPKKPMIGYTRE